MSDRGAAAAAAGGGGGGDAGLDWEEDKSVLAWMENKVCVCGWTDGGGGAVSFVACACVLVGVRALKALLCSCVFWSRTELSGRDLSFFCCMTTRNPRVYIRMYQV